jgi:hypothetical protein
MIPNMPKHTPDVIEKMQECKHLEFYLTGSRYFGDYNSESDWDFFVEESDAAVDFLNSNGFVIDAEHTYSDPTVLKVYRRKGRLGMSVDIQVIAPHMFETKKLAQACIFNTAAYRSCNNKEKKKFLWEDTIWKVIKILSALRADPSILQRDIDTRNKKIGC